MLVIFLFLISCSKDTKKTLGFGKQTIDEFQTIKKAPLTMPKNISLRPPSNASNTKVDYAEQGNSLIFGEETRSLDKNIKNDGEKIFLKELGAHNSDPDIRRKLAKYNTRELSEEFVDKMMFLAPKVEKTGDAIDPYAEKKKIIRKKAYKINKEMK